MTLSPLPETSNWTLKRDAVPAMVVSFGFITRRPLAQFVRRRKTNRGT